MYKVCYILLSTDSMQLVTVSIVGIRAPFLVSVGGHHGHPCSV